MHIVWTVVIGFIVGTIAKFLIPGKDPGGLIITTFLGIGGAVVASLLGRTIGWYGEGEGAGFIAAIVGAIIILAVYRALKKK